MKHTSLYSPCQRFVATLLLWSILLQSCGYSNLELYHDPPAPEHPGQVHGKEPKAKSTEQAAAKSSKVWGEGGEPLCVELPPQPAGPEVTPSPTTAQGSHGLAQNFPQGEPATRKPPAAARTFSKPHHVVIAGAPAARKEAQNKAPQLLARVFTASGGQSIQFHQAGETWWASLTERPGGPVKELSVACKHHGNVEKALAALQAAPDRHAQRLIHVLPAKGQHPPMVYLGEQQLKGGGRISPQQVISPRESCLLRGKRALNKKQQGGCLWHYSQVALKEHRVH